MWVGSQYAASERKKHEEDNRYFLKTKPAKTNELTEEQVDPRSNSTLGSAASSTKDNSATETPPSTAGNTVAQQECLDPETKISNNSLSKNYLKAM